MQQDIITYAATVRSPNVLRFGRYQALEGLGFTF